MIDLNFKKDYLSNLDSTYIPHQYISASTSVQTANQISEATRLLNAGIRGVDISVIDPNKLEMIPKEHFKEISRLTKLSGANPTMHAPIVDLAGFSQQGWSEEARKDVEKQAGFFIDRAHDLNEEGNTPINFHFSTVMPGEEWKKLSKDEYEKLNGEERKQLEESKALKAIVPGKEYEFLESMGVVERETGKITQLKTETKEHPGGIQVWTPERRLRSMNHTQWDEDKLKVFDDQRKKVEIQDRIARIEHEITPFIDAHKKGILKENEINYLSKINKERERMIAHIDELDTHIESNLSEIYNKLKYIPEEYKKIMDINKIKDEIQEDYKSKENMIKPIREKINGFEKKMIQNKLLDENEIEKYNELKNEIRILTAEQTRDLQLKLNQIPAPEIWTSSNKIAVEKTAETISNAAFESYKKYGEHSPMITYENYQPGLVLGRPEEMKKTIEETRKRFAEKLIKEKNIDEDKAKLIAEKLIAVTWDVGHANFLRRHGYSEEDVKKLTKELAPYIKQVHIGDNFGFSDAHLPPGMGNSPIKEQMEIIRKKMKERGIDFDPGGVIVEAGAYVGEFKENPHLYSLEYFNTPLYSYYMFPWKQIWESEGRYFVGHGAYFPEQHVNLYGSGFSGLPAELGGQTSNDRSRFAGTPNA